MRADLAWTVLILVGGLAVTTESWAQSNGSTNTSMGNSGGTLSQAIANSRSFLSGTERASGSASFECNGAEMLMGNQFLRSARGAKSFIGADRGDLRNFLGYATDSGSNSAGQAASNSRRGSRASTTGTSRTGATQRGSGVGNNLRNTTSGGNTNPSRRINLNSSAASNTVPNGTRRGAEVTPVLTLGFESVSVPDRQVQMAAKLKQTTRLSFATPVEVVVCDRVATLSGTVASERDRVLAEHLLVLEPGIDRVENRLTVASPASPSPQ